MGMRSPTMGGLYFWVCKMKPDIPVLGCESFDVLVPEQFDLYRYSLCRSILVVI